MSTPTIDIPYEGWTIASLAVLARSRQLSVTASDQKNPDRPKRGDYVRVLARYDKIHNTSKIDFMTSFPPELRMHIYEQHLCFHPPAKGGWPAILPRLRTNLCRGQGHTVQLGRNRSQALTG